jgi:hypothetical protein
MSRIPEAMREPKALLRRIPLDSKAVRWDNSFRLYHFERRNYWIDKDPEWVRGLSVSTHQGPREKGRLHETKAKASEENANVTKCKC